MFKWFGNRASASDGVKRTKRDWVKQLRVPADENAIADLRAILIRGLKPALYKYIDREPEAFIEDVAQDALIKILDKIETFRGESQFTTWAMKIAVNEGLSELRKKKWKDLSLNDLTGPSQDHGSDQTSEYPVASGDPGPERETDERLILQKVLSIIEHELSPKQKQAMTALMVHEIPITIVAEQMGINRNALYKLVHDARLNLKRKMVSSGVNPDEILQQM